MKEGNTLLISKSDRFLKTKPNFSGAEEDNFDNKNAEITIELNNDCVKMPIKRAINVSPLIREAFLNDNLISTIKLNLDLSQHDFEYLFNCAEKGNLMMVDFCEALGIKNYNPLKEIDYIMLEDKDISYRELLGCAKTYELKYLQGVAANLYCFSVENLGKLSSECLNLLFQCKLRVKSEKILVKTIEELLELKGPSISSIIESIHPEYLSKKYLIKYMNLVKKYFEKPTKKIVLHLKDIIPQNGKIKDYSTTRHTLTKEEIGITLPGDGGVFFNNIDSCIIETTSGRFTHNCQQIVINHQPGQWISADKPNQSITIKLKDILVDITSYSIQTHNGPSLPYNWDFEVMGSDNTWIKADSHENDRALCKNDSITKFTLNKEYKKCKAFRWIETGPTLANDNQFCIRGLEIYGIYYKKE